MSGAQPLSREQNHGFSDIHTQQSHLPQNRRHGMTVTSSLYPGKVHRTNQQQKLGRPEPRAEASFSPTTRMPKALSCLSVGEKPWPLPEVPGVIKGAQT